MSFEKCSYCGRSKEDYEEFEECPDCGVLICGNCMDTSTQGDPICQSCYVEEEDE